MCKIKMPLKMLFSNQEYHWIECHVFPPQSQRTKIDEWKGGLGKKIKQFPLIAQKHFIRGVTYN